MVDREETVHVSRIPVNSWASRESPMVSRMASLFPTSDKAGSVSISQFPLCLSLSLSLFPPPLSLFSLPLSHRFARIFLDVVRDFFPPPSFFPAAVFDRLPRLPPPLPPGHHRLFKIPAGVPSSVLKITPTRLVCRFEPSLVDCDIAPTLLHATPFSDFRSELSLSLSLLLAHISSDLFLLFLYRQVFVSPQPSLPLL